MAFDFASSFGGGGGRNKNLTGGYSDFASLANATEHENDLEESREFSEQDRIRKLRRNPSVQAQMRVILQSAGHRPDETEKLVLDENYWRPEWEKLGIPRPNKRFSFTGNTGYEGRRRKQLDRQIDDQIYVDNRRLQNKIEQEKMIGRELGTDSVPTKPLPTERGGTGYNFSSPTPAASTKEKDPKWKGEVATANEALFRSGAKDGYVTVPNDQPKMGNIQKLLADGKIEYDPVNRKYVTKVFRANKTGVKVPVSLSNDPAIETAVAQANEAIRLNKMRPYSPEEINASKTAQFNFQRENAASDNTANAIGKGLQGFPSRISALDEEAKPFVHADRKGMIERAISRGIITFDKKTGAFTAKDPSYYGLANAATKALQEEQKVNAINERKDAVLDERDDYIAGAEDSGLLVNPDTMEVYDPRRNKRFNFAPQKPVEGPQLPGLNTFFTPWGTINASDLEETPAAPRKPSYDFLPSASMNVTPEESRQAADFVGIPARKTDAGYMDREAEAQQIQRQRSSPVTEDDIRMVQALMSQGWSYSDAIDEVGRRKRRALSQPASRTF